jgi:plastocyanin
MDRRTFLAAVGTTATAAIAGCSAGASSEGDYDVGMTATGFRPAELTVSVGDEVVWKNTSSRAHTVTAYESGLPEGATFFASGGFSSEKDARTAFYEEFEGAINSERTYSHTFEVAGKYPYFCIPHEQAGMVGTVIVEE